MAFVCNNCDFIFKNKYNLERHMSNTIACNIRKNNSMNKICKSCNKQFSSKQACDHHMDGRCKKKLNMEKNNPSPNIYNNMSNNMGSDISDNISPEITNEEKLSNEVLELKKMVQLLSEKLNNIPNISNNPPNNISNNNNSNNNINNSNNNINNSNNNNTINITINPIDKPNIFLDNANIKKILNKGFKSVPELITRLHFDKEHPENHNVYIGNKKDFRLSYFDGNSWILSNNNDILDTLYDNNSDFLIEKFDELEDELDASTLLKFGRYKDNRDESTTIVDNKEEIKFILYNKKNIILDTKKKLI
jgi:hypothetical protein